MGSPSSKHEAVTLYHYTDNKGKDAILKSGYIMRSTDTHRDAVLGNGVYMTSMSPFEHTREDIVQNNWAGMRFKDMKTKTKYVFTVDVSRSNLKSHQKDNRDLYVYGEENLMLDMLEDWTLYDWTSDTPKKIRTGKFSLSTAPGYIGYAYK